MTGPGWASGWGAPDTPGHPAGTARPGRALPWLAPALLLALGSEVLAGVFVHFGSIQYAPGYRPGVDGCQLSSTDHWPLGVAAVLAVSSGVVGLVCLVMVARRKGDLHRPTAAGLGSVAVLLAMPAVLVWDLVAVLGYACLF